jgi:hypothetical protein
LDFKSTNELSGKTILVVLIRATIFDEVEKANRERVAVVVDGVITIAASDECHNHKISNEELINKL